MRDQYHYDERGAFPDYDPFEEDQRTHAQKVVDDNTWQKNEGIALDNDGNPFLEWCEQCKKVVMIETINGSTVSDRYSYTICHVCSIHENYLRTPTEEELREARYA